MAMTREKRYFRARQIADFLMEGGHVVKDVMEEFKISETTYQRDMHLLTTYGNYKEHEKNMLIYIKAKNALYNEVLRRKKEKRE